MKNLKIILAIKQIETTAKNELVFGDGENHFFTTQTLSYQLETIQSLYRFYYRWIFIMISSAVISNIFGQTRSFNQ